MPKTKKTKQSGEQLDLIDVQPENAKTIIRAARIYKELQAARQTALAKEVEQKRQVLNLIRVAKLTPLDNGKIRFVSDNVTITVEPRDELIPYLGERKIEISRWS